MKEYTKLRIVSWSNSDTQTTVNYSQTSYATAERRKSSTWAHTTCRQLKLKSIVPHQYIPLQMFLSSKGHKKR